MCTLPLCHIAFVQPRILTVNALYFNYLHEDVECEQPSGRRLAHLFVVMLPSYRNVLSTALTGLLVLTVTGSAFAKPSVKSPKIDRAVRAAMDAGAATQRVIITVKPGYRDTLRQALTNHGDVVKGDHPLIDAVSVNLHVADVEELANQSWVEAVSSDARVTATATVTPTALLTQPAQTLTGTLRETLGLSRIATSGSMTGATGVSVAV